MEKHTPLHGATTAPPFIPHESQRKQEQALLGYKEMPGKVEKELHRLGVQSQVSLLVRQRYLLRGTVPKFLERKGDSVPAVRSVPGNCSRYCLS